MTKVKTEKIELRVSPDQKKVIQDLAIKFGFEGNVSSMFKDALCDYIWSKYSTDVDQARELTRVINL